MAARKRKLPSLNPQRRSELWGVLLLAGSLLLLMSLVSYDPNDLGFFTSEPNGQVQNLCGVVGAWVAGLIRAGLGLTAFVLPFLGFLWAAARFSRKPLERIWVKFASLLLFCFSVSALLSIVGTQTPEIQVFRGGMLGFLVGDQVQHYFGGWGAVIVLITVALLGLLITTEMAAWPVLTALAQTLTRPIRWGATHGREWMVSGFKKIPELVFQSTRLHRRKTPVEPMLRRKGGVIKRQEVPSRSQLAEVSAPVRGPKREELLIKEMATAVPPNRDDQQQAKFRFRKQKRAVSPPAEGAISSDGASSSEGAPPPFRLPTLDLLDPPIVSPGESVGRDWLHNNAKILEETLRDFGIEVRVAEVELGPVIARYELEPAPGVKIQKISSLTDNLALALKTTSVRVIAPIPGKGRVGIEIPSPNSSMVSLREMLVSSKFQEAASKLALAIGKDTAGYPLVADLAKMPHLLIAGATGSGKTVCVNSLIMAILFNATPEEVRFLMVDPKMVELTVFNGLPHLIMPVMTSAKQVPAALSWVVEEMENRYRLFSKLGIRNIEIYHERFKAGQLPSEEIPGNLPYLVVIIDELADIMLVAQGEVEKIIARLAHLSRAVGIHMVLATQRPSVDVLTGVIKANFPARISFQVASRVDSRTVLDSMGAEKLLGKGDLLFMQPSSSKMTRAQATLVTDGEIGRVVEFLKGQYAVKYDVTLPEQESKGSAGGVHVKDALYDEAVRVAVETGQASVSLLQRRMRLGYGRAARILDMMEEEGIVGPIRGAKPREVFLKEIPDEPVDRRTSQIGA